jgi:hypothetical protein
MKVFNIRSLIFVCAAFTSFLGACGGHQKPPPLFEVMDDNKTGLHFTNKLTPGDSFNVFHYMYFYNGAGLGAGDLNNDGLTDLFFASNQGYNKLFLNTGNLQFKDVSAEAQIPRDDGWNTGVSIVDINNDGLLDIYVSRVGNYEILKGQNLFLICTGVDKNGVPHYIDKAREMGLDFSGFATQAAFLDYDMDGDLDMFLLDHSVHEKGVFRPRKEFDSTAVVGDRLYRNDGGAFTDVTAQSGIISSPIGYGLGLSVADINLDGYPDIYVANDFHENDYLYINQKNGRFKEELNSCIMHTSQFSMGVDIADVNNDALPDIISMDMQPFDPYILKRSLGEDEYDIFQRKIKSGYNYQYARNNFQLNRGNGKFSEIGLYSGISATDWSWGALWMDFDDDGYKDLFVSNGIPKRMNDIDYINFVSNSEIQEKIRTHAVHEKDIALSDKFPQIKIPNKFFRNTGQLSFADLKDSVDEKSSYSNGAVYADFDNDGDLDIVVNNIDEPAILYRNTSNDNKSDSVLTIKLQGPDGNINALGAKLVVFAGSELRTYEKYPVKGFLSSSEIPLHVGLKNTKVDSMLLIWPDNSYEKVNPVAHQPVMSIKYSKRLPAFDYARIMDFKKKSGVKVEDITRNTALDYLHIENEFPEFSRDPLIPHMFSAEGPALTVADINKDGLEDVFIGSAKWGKSGVFLQQASGKFIRIAQPELDKDSVYEDVSACWTDVNNDGHADLIVASGGSEFYGNDQHLSPRLYINKGNGQLVKAAGAFDHVFVNASVVLSSDFNGDGFKDLFVGGRSVPWEYGKIPPSFLLQNDGRGNFRDVTASIAKELPQVGFVKNAIWTDIDKDNDDDLVLALEWDGIAAFINDKGHFTKKMLTDKKGWWNFIFPVDINQDGNIDLIAGNLGLNSRLKASETEPVRFYYNDFDDNGKKEQVITYYLGGKEIPWANKAELEKQMPVLKKRFLYAGEFAKATLQEIFTEKKLSSSTLFTANYFSNSVLINKGNGQFETQPLPWQAQLTPYKDAVVVNANDDSLPDIYLGGNFYENNIEMGRYDADFGTVLLNKGNGILQVAQPDSFSLRGQVRHIQPVKIAGKNAFILARNNDSAMVIRFGH